MKALDTAIGDCNERRLKMFRRFSVKPIAICQNKNIFDHSGSWVPRLVEYCSKNEIPFEIVDGYHYDIVKQLPRFSALIWIYQNYVLADQLEARNILQTAENLGLVTFPSSIMNWHFDDKIAEMYALQSINAPIPHSWVFYIETECVEWLKKEAHYPLVAKLRCGSGSNNVRMFLA